MVKSSARALWKSMSLYTMYAYEPVAWLASPSVTFGVRWEISGRSVGDPHLEGALETRIEPMGSPGCASGREGATWVLRAATIQPAGSPRAPTHACRTRAPIQVAPR